MKYKVLKSFTWNGRVLSPGETIEIPDGHAHIRGMVQSKFIKFSSGKPGPAKVEEPLPSVAEVVKEVQAPVLSQRPNPREIVAAAKAKAARGGNS